MDDEDLGPLDGWARLGAPQLAAICKVSRRTAHHWIATNRMPERARQWLHLTHYGELGTICKTWDGWKLYTGGLCSPSGLYFTPANVETLPLMRDEHRLQRLELLQLRAREKNRLDIERKKFQLGQADHNEPASHFASNSRLARI